MNINKEQIELAKTFILSKNSKINTILIEKDFYITEILKIINKELCKFKEDKKIIDYFLRGGTSLSKCFLKTNRLSEDIDLTLVCESVTKGKQSIFDITKIFDNLNRDNFIKIIKTDKVWTNPRKYLNVEFMIDDITIQFDIKFITKDSSLINMLNLKEHEIYNISEKMGFVQKQHNLSINVLSLEYTVAEKIIGFQKNYLYNRDKRCYRHLYDIYMIFSKRLLENNIHTWKTIKNIYDEIIKTEIDINEENVKTKYETLFEDTFVLSQTINKDKEHKDRIISLIETECYDSVKCEDILNFYMNLNTK